jgi:hypothetical protein
VAVRVPGPSVRGPRAVGSATAAGATAVLREHDAAGLAAAGPVGRVVVGRHGTRTPGEATRCQMDVRYVLPLSPDPARCVAERFVRRDVRIDAASSVGIGYAGRSTGNIPLTGGAAAGRVLAPRSALAQACGCSPARVCSGDRNVIRALSFVRAERGTSPQRLTGCGSRTTGARLTIPGFWSDNSTFCHALVQRSE